MIKWLFLLFTGAAAALLPAAEIPFERSEVTSPLKIGTRKKVLPYTHIFARIQPYNLYGNYLEWIDRPLYLDTRWRSGKAAEAFRKDAEIAMQEYEIAGFTMLGNAYESRYLDALTLLKRSGIRKFDFMPGMAWKPESLFSQRDINNAKWAYASEYTWRINGKVPFFNYRSTPPGNVAAYRKFLEKNGYKDNLLFNSFMFNVYSEFNRTGNISPETRQRELDRAIQLLSTADGMVLTNYHMLRNEKKDYYLARKFNYLLDDKFLAPMVEGLFVMPEHQHKLLGFDVRHGYIGHRSGVVEAQQGTAQFRQAMDTALLFNPDIISLVEWNEANENTSLQPTVSSGKTMQRLVRFYARKLKGLPAAPNPGDDLTMPNLIVSVRRAVNYGEYYRIELLNVPDAETEEKYTVKLILKDENGQLIRNFEPDTFIRSKLTAVTYRIPSELLAPRRAVIPELEVVWQGSTRQISGLRATLLEVSLSSDQLEARTPIRDILNCSAQWQIRNGNISGEVTAPAGKLLTSVEVIDRETPVIAVDKTPEFSPDTEDNILLWFHARKQQMAQLDLSVPGAEKISFRPWGRPYAGFGKLELKGNRIAGNILLFHGGSALVMRVPKAANGDIVLNLQGHKYALPLAKLRKCRQFAAEFGTLGGVRFELRTRPDDHPEPLELATVKFSGKTEPLLPDPAYSLLILGDNGKVWRSAPRFPLPESVKMVPVKVFSAYRSQPVTVMVPESRILRADYRFTPEYGTLFTTAAAPAFDGQLGNGFFYIFPMRGARLPANAGPTAPAWHRENDGSYRLDFDGKANYTVFPIDAIPAAAATAVFECRPANSGNMVLLRSTHMHPGGVQSWIENGTLRLAFARFSTGYGAKSDEFDTNLAITPGTWNRIKLSYDFEYLRAEVNGKVWMISYRHRPAFFCAAIFGGFSSADRWFNLHLKSRQIGFFCGSLRKISFYHNAEVPTAADLKAMKHITYTQQLQQTLNGTFRRGSSKLPKNWYFNRGYKPHGTSAVINGKNFNTVKLAATFQAPVQIYSAPVTGKAGDEFIIEVRVSGGSGLAGVSYYDADSRYCRGGESFRFAAGEKTLRLPVKLRDIAGQNPTAMFRITLTADPGSTVCFSQLQLHTVMAGSSDENK